MILIALLALAAGTYAMKAVGPILSSGRPLPLRAGQLAHLLPAALLAALVATQTIASGTTLQLDARVAGLAAAAVCVWMKAPFAVVVLAGASVTATVRMLGWA